MSQRPPVVLVADPPWMFDDDLPGDGRGAAKHYPCMSLAELMAMPIPVRLEEPNAVLFLWRVHAMQREALDLAEHWGFTVKSELVWRKMARKAAWLEFFGLGRYVRAAHEVCLIATRGQAAPECRSIRSIFSARVRAHSQKPEAFYQIVECLYPRSPKFELFARTIRPGWVQHGNQLGALPLERLAA
jgi:N6-adenosine-specific RNA methylase IME4